MTMKWCWVPSTESASARYVRTTFSCRMLAPRSASRMNRRKNPGVSSRCGCTTLSATCVPSSIPGTRPATVAA